MVTLGLYWGIIGIMEKKLESTIVEKVRFWEYIGIM